MEMPSTDHPLLLAQHRLVQLLPFSALLTWRAVCRETRQAADAELKQRQSTPLDMVRSYALQHGLGDTFWAALQKSHAFISGSYLLAALTGASWTPGDVDIYCFADDAGIVDWIERQRKSINVAATRVGAAAASSRAGVEVVVVDDDSSADDDDCRGVATGKAYKLIDEDGYCDTMSHINSVLTYRSTSQSARIKLQVILMNRQPRLSLREQVMSQFDIDACKNTFDGKQLTIAHPLSLAGPSDVRLKQRYELRTRERQRGRKRVVEELAVFPQKQSLMRVEKYLERGMLIQRTTSQESRRLTKSDKQPTAVIVDVYANAQVRWIPRARIPAMLAAEYAVEQQLHSYERVIDGQRWVSDAVLFELASYCSSTRNLAKIDKQFKAQFAGMYGKEEVTTTRKRKTIK